MANEITEQTYSETDLNKKTVGGNFSQRFNPQLFIENGIKSRVYEVKSFKGAYLWTKPGTQQTNERFEWYIVDMKGDEYVLSSWAFITKEVFTPLSLVGKTIVLSAKDEKRCILTFQKD